MLELNLALDELKHDKSNSNHWRHRATVPVGCTSCEDPFVAGAAFCKATGMFHQTSHDVRLNRIAAAADRGDPGLIDRLVAGSEADRLSRQVAGHEPPSERYNKECNPTTSAA